ncbi:Peptidase family M13 containing protein [Aphelenchoides avenae]|nr:Peptidase family M13 containing protein [Aphelenchus avenae]
MRRWEIFVFACLIASHDVASAQTADGYNRAAKLLLDAIDESKNPCDDFYEFSCGKWSTTNALKEGEQLRDSFSSAAKKVDQDMTVLLAECSYGGSKAINAVKMFYDTCMNKDRQQPKKSYEVIHHLVNFGYWPIIQPKWNAADYDLTQLLIHVAKAGAPTHLVTLKVEQNFKDSMQKVLMVEQDKPTLETAYLGQSEEEKKFVEFYERNLNEIVAILAKDAGSCRTAVEIAADVRGIADFERRLAEINEQDDPGADLSEASNLMKLSELAILLPAINWQHLLREVLPPEARSFVGTDPLVNVLNPNFVQRLNRLLQNTGPRVVTNYVLYRYVMDFKDSLDGRFDAILDVGVS